MKRDYFWQKRVLSLSKYLCFSLLLSLVNAVSAEDLVITKAKGALPSDPMAADWQQAPAQDVAVLAQQMAMPTLATASITKLTVQALTDGKQVAWRLSWADSTADYNVDTGRFSDAVAIELPLDKGAAPMMGHKGAKVQILYWKALWQKDIDVGFQDVQDIHPNYWTDLYWFAEGKFPYRVPEAFKNPVSHQWFIGKQAGNSMSVFDRKQPVQELIAEGWGTLTAQADSKTTGKGVWANGRWTVMFARPLTTEDANDHQFKNPQGQVAFAVWQGGDNNSGGRKHWSNWVNYQLQP